MGVVRDMGNPVDVVVTITAHTQSAEHVREVLRNLAPTREEPGCLRYDVYESSEGVFVEIETWRSEAERAAHEFTPHVQAALTQVGDHLAATPTWHVLTPIPAASRSVN